MKLVIFSWGYYGWGGAPDRLVEAVDAVEQARGFDPPLFVDTRIRREVRAKGFVGEAFAKVAGKERYLWLKGLGNRSIVTGTGPLIQIDRPEAARELLARAAEESRRRRRLLFFCSCRWPLNNPGEDASGPEPCHRHQVAALVLGYARGEVPPIEAEVIEWPGGDPVMADLTLPRSRLRQFHGRKSIPLGPSLPAARWCGLPWGSTVSIRCDDGVLHVVSGPASYHQERRRADQGEWRLPVLGTAPSPDMCLSMAAEFRARHGLDARS
jgi:hypothetical protein